MKSQIIKNRRQLTASLIAIVTMSTVVTACTKSQPEPFRLAQDVTGIISTRPDMPDVSFFMVKLHEAPLLTTVSQKDGKKIVDARLLKAIDDEQNAVLKELKALSSDIVVIYRYRMVINGFAISAPTALVEKIGAISGVAQIESTGRFDRPVLPMENASASAASTIKSRNSVKFIGGDKAHARGVRGQGMRIGIIDTGVDYTHAMLGGSGSEAAFTAIKPSEPSPAFPNAKVVGGVDFAGTDFNTASPDFRKHIPVIDSNPIDEGGHGSHVAGSVAGNGDGVNTYDGVAPEATLYALKVFGANGSTSDNVVIAALEYSADPNADADISDALDVVNLSLGAGYGSGHILYSQAIRNLSAGGTVVVCSGGNSGDIPYIVGSPGATDEALSVAASVDDMDQNWKFPAAKFTTVENPEIYTEAIESALTKPLDQLTSMNGSVVYAGLADQDFDAALATKVAGNIALIDRGVVSFADKIARAEKAGAIAVIVANNQTGAASIMGGDVEKSFGIPAVMISQETGKILKSYLSKGRVTADLKTPKRIEKPELIDTMARFSSKGPRSIDSLLKPEISAPGSLIISAKMGGGAAGIQMSGTSMAAPHIAGVMALMKQTHPDLSVAELKALVMSTAKTMVDEKKQMYPISRQGAGRVQIMKALDTPVVPIPSAISFGEITLESRKSLQKRILMRNISDNDLTLNVALSEASEGLTLTKTKPLSIAKGKSAPIDLRLTLDSPGEVSGFVIFSDQNGEVARIPVLAVANKTARPEAKDLFIRSTSNIDSQVAAVDLTLTNKSANSADVLPFNFIASGPRKEDPTLDPFRSKICDLEQSGYRVLDMNGTPTLQIAAKIYEPMTTWDLCEVSVLIDSNGDFEADQELAGVKQNHLEGLPGSAFSSILLDTKTAIEIRRDFQKAIQAPPVEPKPGEPKPKAPVLDFTPAIVALAPMQVFDHATIAIVEVPVADLKLKPSGALAVRIATSAQTGSAIEPDDFLSKNPKKWKSLNVSLAGPSFIDLPEKITLAAGQSTTITFTKGAGNESLLLLYPNGKTVVTGIGSDEQSQVLRPSYKVE